MSSPDPADFVVTFTRDARTVGLENGWHSDGTFRPMPTMGTMLRAIEVPDVGGDTVFADMAAAFDNLSPELRDRIAGRTALHDWSLGAYASKYGDDLARLQKELPPVRHPVVIRHPITDRPTLFVNRLFTASIDGAAIRRERRAARPAVSSGGPARAAVSIPLGAGLHRLLGQPGRAALRRERLLPRSSRDGAGDLVLTRTHPTRGLLAVRAGRRRYPIEAPVIRVADRGRLGNRICLAYNKSKQGPGVGEHEKHRGACGDPDGVPGEGRRNQEKPRRISLPVRKLLHHPVLRRRRNAEGRRRAHRAESEHQRTVPVVLIGNEDFALFDRGRPISSHRPRRAVPRSRTHERTDSPRARDVWPADSGGLR